MNQGAKVVCVNDTFKAWAHTLYTALPVKGATYTVRAMYPAREVLGMADGRGDLIKNGGSTMRPGVGILLVELVNPADPLCPQRELGFNAERFAPLETVEEEVHATQHAGATA